MTASIEAESTVAVRQVSCSAADQCLAHASSDPSAGPSATPRSVSGAVSAAMLSLPSPSALQRPAIVERVEPVIVLNGGSSSGKTSIARCLQRLLGPTWLTLGVDDLIRALPGGNEVDDPIRAQRGGGEPVGTEGSIEIGPDGSVTVGDDFRRAEASWYAGVAAIGRCGTGLIVDEVFMGGRSSQERLASALAGLPVVWVGVRCDPEVAAAREHGRPDRVDGMARLQATRVHEGVIYDLAVDTSAASAADCARTIASHLSASTTGG